MAPVTRDDRLRRTLARDPRHDGTFVVAVTSTRIYCRPSCPVPPPRAENMRFLDTSAQALAAGFRACKRCLPDAVPGAPGWDGRDDVVARAVRALEDTPLATPAEVAAAVGVPAGELDAALGAELGVGVADLAFARRLTAARWLLEGSDAPLAAVAAATGFAGPDELDAAVRRGFARDAAELRSRAGRPGGLRHPATTGAPLPAPSGGDVRVRLAYRPPLPFAAMVTFLRSRAVAGVEEVDGDTYRRTLSLPGGHGVVAVGPGGHDARGHWLDATFRLDDLRDLPAAVRRTRRLFGLDADPAAVDEALGGDPLLAPAVAADPGRRVPGHVDGVELAFRAVLGQQVSVAAARTLAGRLADRHGARLARPVGSLTVAFPTASAVAGGDLDGLGLTGARRATLRTLGAALAAGDVRLDAGAGRAEAERALVALPGIGPWTAAYVRMRAFGDPDAFLPTDLGVRRSLERLGYDGAPRAAAALAERWAPFRAYAVQHLWALLAPDAPGTTGPRGPAPGAPSPTPRRSPGPGARPRRRPSPAPAGTTVADTTDAGRADAGPGTAAGPAAARARRRRVAPVAPFRRYDLVDSPMGSLLVVADEDGGLTGVHFQPDERWGVTVADGWELSPRHLAGVADQLAAYFAGRLHRFELPLAAAGTPFQRRVWEELVAIPYGETASYGELAEALGRPSAARAVGAANARNPLAIVVPCHRVVGSDRSLTGYAGGLARKEALLALEADGRSAASPGVPRTRFLDTRV